MTKHKPSTTARKHDRNDCITGVTQITFTYFAPRSPRPSAELDDRAYAAEHAKQARPTSEHTVKSLRALRNWIAARAVEGRKGDAGYIIAGTCTKRRNDVSGPAAFVLIDYDGADIDWSEAEQYEGFAWTTASHTPEAPAWRLLIMLKEPAQHGKLECPLKGGHIRVQHQPAFLPTHQNDTAAIEWRELGGRKRLEAAALASGKARSKRQGPLETTGLEPYTVPYGQWGSQVPDVSALAKTFPPAGMSAGDMRHPTIRGLGGWLARLGYSDAAIKQSVRTHFLGRTNQLDERVAQAVEAAKQFRSGDVAAGWGALEEWVAAGWGNRSTLPALKSACSDAEMPEGWAARCDGTGEGWSEWWRRYWPRWVAGCERRASAAIVRAAHSASGAADAPAYSGPHTDGTNLHLHSLTGWPWLLQRGNSFWMHDVGSAQYGRLFPQAELGTRVARQMAGLLKDEDRTLSELQAKWISPVEWVTYSYTAERTTYEPKTKAITVAALNRMPAERARYHAAIDEWLRALFGEQYDRGAAWLASCLHLDRSAPCLYLVGDLEIGKSLLFAGLAQLWGCTSPVDMSEVVSDFNEKQCECPLVYSDEGLPPKLDFARFRNMVTEHSSRVNRKQLNKVDVYGCPRLAIGANNDAVLRWARHGELTDKDQKAIASRLLVLRCGEGAARVLRAQTPETLRAWALGSIAEHVLWLASAEGGAELAIGERMCVEPYGGEALIRAVVNDRYAPIATSIVEALSQGKLGREIAHVWRSKKDDRCIFVHAEQLYEWITSKDRRVRIGDVREACKALARPHGEVAKQQRLPGTDDTRICVYSLDVDKVAGAAGVDLV